MPNPVVTADLHANTRPFQQQTLSALRSIQKQIDRNPLKLNIDSRGANALGKISKDAGQFDKSLAAANARIIAFGASLGIISSITLAFKSLVTTTIEVQKQLQQIRIVSDASNESFENFRRGIFDVARETGQSFKTIATAAGEFARQGLSIEQTLKRTRDAAILTRQSGLELTKSVEAITGAINTFTNEALDSTDVINRLAAVDSKFAVSSRDLAEGLSRVSNVAQDVGVDFNKVIALIAALQQRTARGGPVISNALKSIFSRLQRTDTQDAFEALGIQVRDFNGKVLGADVILQNLANTYDSLTSAQKSTVAELGAGVYQINILKGLVADLSSNYSAYTQALDTATNAQDNAIQKNNLLNQTLATTIENTKTNITELFSDIGNLTVEPIIRSLLANFNDFLDLTKSIGGTDAGKSIGEGLVKGIVTYFQSGGALLIFAIIGKLALKVASFAKDSLGSLTGLNKAGQDQQNIQSKINTLLLSGNDIYRQRFLAAKTLQQQEKVILDLLRQQSNLKFNYANAALAQSISTRPSGREVRRAADGYLPEVINQEKSSISRGVGGASSSARPVVIPNFNFGKGRRGTAVANSDEYIVPNFGGGSAIFNPEMIANIGLPRGARKLAQGYIPNYIAAPRKVGVFEKLLGLIPSSLKPNIVTMPSGNKVDITKVRLPIFEKNFKQSYGIPFSDYYRRRELQRSAVPSSVYDPTLNDTVPNTIFRRPPTNLRKEQTKAIYDRLIGRETAIKTDIQSITKKLKTGRNSVRLINDNQVAELRRLKDGNFSLKTQGLDDRLISSNLLDLVSSAKSRGFRAAGKTGQSLGLAQGFIPNLADDFSVFQSKAWLDPNGRLINVKDHPDIETGPFKSFFQAKRQSFVRVQREGNRLFAPSNKLNQHQRRTLKDLSIIRGYELNDDNRAFADGFIPNYNLSLMLKRIATIRKYVGLQGKNSLLVKKDTPTYIQDYLSKPENQEILKRIGITKVRYNSPSGELPGFNSSKLYSSDRRGSTFSLTGEKKLIEGEGNSFNSFRKIITAIRGKFDMSRAPLSISSGAVKPLSFSGFNFGEKKENVGRVLQKFRIFGSGVAPIPNTLASASDLIGSGKTNFLFPLGRGKHPFFSESGLLRDKKEQRKLLNRGDILGRPEDIGDIPLIKGAVRGLRFNKTASTYDIVESLLQKGILDGNTGQLYQNKSYSQLELTREQADNVRGYIKNLGYIPNFANPLQAAISRERAAGIPNSLIRIDQNSQLRSSANPLGLAVTNLRDEPGGKASFGINRVKSLGQDPRKAGIPNFADPFSDPLVLREMKRGAVGTNPLLSRETERARKEQAALIKRQIQQEKEILAQKELEAKVLDEKVKSLRRQKELENRQKRIVIGNTRQELLKKQFKEIEQSGNIRKFDSFAASNSRFFSRENIAERDVRASLINRRDQSRQNKIFGASFLLPIVGETVNRGLSGLGDPNDQRFSRGASSVIGGASTALTGAAFGPVGAVIGGVVGGFQALTGIVNNLNKSLEDVVNSYQEQINKEKERGAAVQGVAEAEGRLQDLITAGASESSISRQGNTLARAISSVRSESDRREIQSIFKEPDPIKRQEKLGNLNAQSKEREADEIARGQFAATLSQALGKQSSVERFVSDLAIRAATFNTSNLDKVNEITGFGRGSTLDKKSAEAIKEAIGGLNIEGTKVPTISRVARKQFLQGDEAGALKTVFKSAGASDSQLKDLSETISAVGRGSLTTAGIFDTLFEKLKLISKAEQDAKKKTNEGQTFLERNQVFARSLSTLSSNVDISTLKREGRIQKGTNNRIASLQLESVFSSGPFQDLSNQIQESVLKANESLSLGQSELQKDVSKNLIENVLGKAQVGNRQIFQQALDPVFNSSQADFGKNLDAAIQSLLSNTNIKNDNEILNVLKDIKNYNLNGQRTLLESQLNNLAVIKDNSKNGLALRKKQEERADVFERRGGIEAAIDPSVNKDTLTRLREGSIALAEANKSPFLSANRSTNEALRAGRGGKIIDLLNTSKNFLGEKDTQEIFQSRFGKIIKAAEVLEKTQGTGVSGAIAQIGAQSVLKSDVAFQDIRKSFERNSIEVAASTLPSFFPNNPAIGKGIDEQFNRLGGFTARNAGIVQQGLRGQGPNGVAAANFLGEEITKSQDPKKAVNFLKETVGLVRVIDKQITALNKNTSATEQQSLVIKSQIEAMDGESTQGISSQLNANITITPQVVVDYDIEAFKKALTVLFPQFYKAARAEEKSRPNGPPPTTSETI